MSVLLFCVGLAVHGNILVTCRGDRVCGKLQRICTEPQATAEKGDNRPPAGGICICVRTSYLNAFDWGTALVDY